MSNFYKKYKIHSLHFDAYHDGTRYVLPNNYIADIEFDRTNNPINSYQGRYFFNMPSSGSISFISHLSPYYQKENGEYKADVVYNLPIREDVITINENLDQICCSDEESVDRYINFFGRKLYFKRNPYLDYDSSQVTGWTRNQWNNISGLYNIINYYSFASYGNRNEGVYTGFLNGFTGYSGISIDISGTGAFAFFDKGYLLNGSVTDLDRSCRGCIDEVILNTGYYESTCNGTGKGYVTGEIRLRYNPYKLLQNQEKVNQEKFSQGDLTSGTYISYHAGNYTNDPLNPVQITEGTIENSVKLFDKNYFPYFVQALNLNAAQFKNFAQDGTELPSESDQTYNFKYIPNITGQKIFLSRQYNTYPVISENLLSGQIYSGLYKGVEPYIYQAGNVINEDNTTTPVPKSKFLSEKFYHRLTKSGTEERIYSGAYPYLSTDLICWLDASDSQSYVVGESLYSTETNKVLLWKNKVYRSGDYTKVVGFGDAVPYEVTTGCYVSGYVNSSGILAFNSPTEGDTFSVTGYFTGFGSTIITTFSSTPGNVSPSYFDSIKTLNAIINSGYFNTGIKSTLRGVTGLNIISNYSGELGNRVRICTSYDPISNTTAPKLLNNKFIYNPCDGTNLSGFLDGGINYNIFTTGTKYYKEEATTQPSAGPSFGITGQYGQLSGELNYPNLSINFNPYSSMILTGLNQILNSSSFYTIFLVENGTTGIYNRLFRSKIGNTTVSSLASGSILKTDAFSSTKVGVSSGPAITNPYINSGINVTAIRYTIGNVRVWSNQYTSPANETVSAGVNFDDVLLGANYHSIPTGFVYTGNVENIMKTRYSGAHLGLSGNVCEILIYNNTFSAADTNITMTYLAQKWSGLLSGAIQNSGLVPKYQDQQFAQSYKVNSSNLCTECVDSVPKSGGRHILLMEYDLYGNDSSRPEDCLIDASAYVIKTGYYEESPKEPAIMKLSISDTQIFPTGYVNSFTDVLNQYNVVKNIKNRGQVIHNLQDFNYTTDSVNFDLTNYNLAKLRLDVEKPNCNCTGSYLRFYKIDALGDKSGCNLSNLNNFLVNIYDSGSKLILSEDFSNRGEDVSGNNYAFVVGLYPGTYDIMFSGKERYFDYGPDRSTKFLNPYFDKVVSSNNYTNISNLSVELLENQPYYDVGTETPNIVWASYNLDLAEVVYGSGYYGVNYNKPKAFTMKLRTFTSGIFDYPELSFSEQIGATVACGNQQITNSICEGNYANIAALCSKSLEYLKSGYSLIRVNNQAFPFQVFQNYLTYTGAGQNYYDLVIDSRMKALCCLCQPTEEEQFALSTISCIQYSGISLSPEYAKRAEINSLNTGIYFLDTLSLNDIKNKYASSIYSGSIKIDNLLEGDQFYFNNYSYDYKNIFKKIFEYEPVKTGIEYTFTYSIENNGGYYFSGAQQLANLINNNLTYTGYATWIPTLDSSTPYYKIGGLLSGRVKNSGEVEFFALNSGKLGQYDVGLRLVDRRGFDMFQVPKIVQLQGSNDGENWDTIISSQDYMPTNVYQDNPNESNIEIRYDLIQPELNVLIKDITTSTTKETKTTQNLTGDILNALTGNTFIETRTIGDTTLKCYPADGQSGRLCGSGFLDVLQYTCESNISQENAAGEEKKDKQNNKTSGTYTLTLNEYVTNLGYANYNEISL